MPPTTLCGTRWHADYNLPQANLALVFGRFFELLDFGESQLEAQPTISGSFRRKTPQTKPKSNIAQHKTSNNSKILPASEGDIGKIANGQT